MDTTSTFSPIPDSELEQTAGGELFFALMMMEANCTTTLSFPWMNDAEPGTC